MTIGTISAGLADSGLLPVDGPGVAPRRYQEPDLAPYEAVMAEALTAYGMDFEYAEQMSKAARYVLRRRAVWQARMLLREAEKSSHEACTSSGPTVCAITSTMCGTGPCPFTTLPELAALTEVEIGPARSGKPSTRPRPGPDGIHASYRIEDSVAALHAARKAAEPVPLY